MKNTIKAKPRSEVRVALMQGTLFTNVTLNDREVTFKLSAEFNAQPHHRIINQVLKSLRNSSSSLKQGIYDIKNVNRYPTLTLTKKHQFADGQALLSALVAAQMALKPVEQTLPLNIQADDEFWDFLSQEELDLDLDSPLSSFSSCVSHSSSSEDFFESLFPESNPLLYDFNFDVDQPMIDTVCDVHNTEHKAVNSLPESCKENSDIRYTL